MQIKLFEHLREITDWKKRSYAAPSPNFIKRPVLLAHGIANSVWVETGTYLGDTTALLSKHAKHVYSIEPEPTLFAKAKQRFGETPNVEIIEGTSETVFPDLLPKLNGDINFWLDGHYSAGNTFKGDKDTPIVEELKTISRNRKNFKNICVMVDDVRCFDPRQLEYSAYPALDLLVDWARHNKLSWHIEHDIFVAKS